MFVVMPRSCCRYLSVAAILATAGNAWAAETHAYPECTTKPSESDVTAAKGAFQAGTVSFNEADYQRAILYWEDAFRRDCTATLLLHHLGRAYEGLGNLEQAVIALRTYTERAPDSSERAQVLRRIDVFEQRIAESNQQAAAKEPAPAVAVEPSPQKVAPKKVVASPVAEAQPQRAFPWLQVAVIAGGGVATLVGGLVYLNAHSDMNDVESLCGGTRTKCPPSLAERGNDARSRAQIGTGVFIGGLAVAGAGVVWLLLDTDHPKPTKAALALQPWVGAQSAGLSWQGAF